jgi:hypothetical protein
MVDHAIRCEQCGTLTMTKRFGLGEALDQANFCLTCCRHAVEELEYHGAQEKHADVGGEA